MVKYIMSNCIQQTGYCTTHCAFENKCQIYLKCMNKSESKYGPNPKAAEANERFPLTPMNFGYGPAKSSVQVTKEQSHRNAIGNFSFYLLSFMGETSAVWFPETACICDVHLLLFALLICAEK